MHHNDLKCTECYAKRIRSDNITRLKHLKDLPKAQLVDCGWPGACRYCDDNERKYDFCRATAEWYLRVKVVPKFSNVWYLNRHSGT